MLTYAHSLIQTKIKLFSDIFLATAIACMSFSLS